MAKTPVKFLLVDDLEENLLALEGLLRRDEVDLLKARSGPEALELLLVHDVALVLLDVQMPVMDGFEVAELMRGTERTRRVPIIFITAGAMDIQRRFRGYEAGAVDFLFKPIEPHILKSKAEVFFELFRQRQEVARQRDELRIVAEENARLLSESRRNEEEVRQIRDELARANTELERRVQERTARLRETIGDLEHFSYTITHDMRAPLRSMEAFGKILMEENAPQLDPAGKDFLRRIVDSARRMDQLITDSLSYSKIVRGEMELSPVDVGALLRGMIESYPEFQPPKAEIELAGDIPLVLGNQAALTQCFSNLLGNAVKFVAPDKLPKIRVWPEVRQKTGPEQSIASETGLVRIYVEDNGIGIPPEFREKIFAMFQKLSKNYQGTGIGLALVKKVVERMKGRVGVESAPDQGSRFWVELRRALVDV
jgi:signal transduction histidine kinase